MRQRLLALVAEQPGINKSGVCGRLGLAWGTVTYHVAILAEAGLVQVDAAGREANLFPRGVAEGPRRRLKALRDPGAQRVLDGLARVREAGLHELSERIGLSRKVVRRHLVQLLDAGLVEDKGTRRGRYALSGAGRPGLATAGPPASLGAAPFGLRASEPDARTPTFGA